MISRVPSFSVSSFSGHRENCTTVFACMSFLPGEKKCCSWPAGQFGEFNPPCLLFHCVFWYACTWADDKTSFFIPHTSPGKQLTSKRSRSFYPFFLPLDTISFQWPAATCQWLRHHSDERWPLSQEAPCLPPSSPPLNLPVCSFLTSSWFVKWSDFWHKPITRGTYLASSVSTVCSEVQPVQWRSREVMQLPCKDSKTIDLGSSTWISHLLHKEGEVGNWAKVAKNSCLQERVHHHLS